MKLSIRPSLNYLIYLNKLIYLSLSLSAILLIQSCDEYEYKPSSQGDFSQIIVVMDSTQWNGEVAEALKKVFAAPIMTMPRPEPMYDLVFVDIQSESDIAQIKKKRNVILAASLGDTTLAGRYINSLMDAQVKEKIKAGEPLAVPLTDRWALDQWVLVLSAANDSSLVNHIYDQAENLVYNIDTVERSRWSKEVFDKAQQKGLSDSLRQKHAFKMGIQHDYLLSIDTTQFVSLARLMPENYRYVWVFWDEGINDITQVDESWVNARRDSLLKQWVHGTRPGTYVMTQYEFPIKTEIIDFKGFYAYETRGAWRMNNFSMGGSFLQYSVYVPQQKRLYYLIGSIFAPAVPHRRFLNQFDAILWSFEPDTSQVL
jgi:hypothetical protein